MALGCEGFMVANLSDSGQKTKKLTSSGLWTDWKFLGKIVPFQGPIFVKKLSLRPILHTNKKGATKLASPPTIAYNTDLQTTKYTIQKALKYFFVKRALYEKKVVLLHPFLRGTRVLFHRTKIMVC